jgi:capsular polysaccharide biosynthesis protein
VAGIGDEWFESEGSTRRAMVSELQRIRRRTRTHWLRVVIATALISGAIYYKLSHKIVLHDAQVVLALTEESLSSEKHRSIPVDELREYVVSVLLPAKELEALIERRDLTPLRKTAGMDLAIQNLFEQTDIQIWKNSFVDFDESEANALRSARIGITVTDADPDRAMGIARDLAAIIKRTSDKQRQEIANALAEDAKHLRDALEVRQQETFALITTKLVALATAQKLGQKGTAAALESDVANLYKEQRGIAGKLSSVVGSQESIADRISAAGLDMSVEVVEENPPEKNEQRGFVMVLVMVVVVFGTLFGCALVIGAFDSRVHDLEDVERLNLPVLGHVPGFPGDHVGSLAARGAGRTRVPSSSRWRSPR